MDDDVDDFDCDDEDVWTISKLDELKTKVVVDDDDDDDVDDVVQLFELMKVDLSQELNLDFLMVVSN